jgi:hypothetical protein
MCEENTAYRYAYNRKSDYRGKDGTHFKVGLRDILTLSTICSVHNFLMQSLHSDLAANDLQCATTA